MSLMESTDGVQARRFEQAFAIPDQLCSVCQQSFGDNRRDCDSCCAVACQMCAKTAWEWNDSGRDVRHKCHKCKQATIESSILQQCLNRAQSATQTNPNLSAALYEFVLPWLPKDQKMVAEKRKGDYRVLADAQQQTAETLISVIGRRAQEKFNCGRFDVALELWGALYDVRPDDDHVCRMMVKAQVWSQDMEINDSSQMEHALDFIKVKLDDAIEFGCFELAAILCELCLKLQPGDAHMMRKLTEAELKRSEELERFQPSPVASIKTTLQLELDAARDQGDAEREASLMRVLEATLIQEHRHYQALGRQKSLQ